MRFRLVDLPLIVKIGFAPAFALLMLAAVAGGLFCTITIWLVAGKPDVAMIGNGVLAGLVAITAPCGAVDPFPAFIIGGIGGVLVVFSVFFFDKVKIDDPVGAISVHGVVGIWGLLAVPITNSDASLITQLIGAAVIFGFVMIASLIAWGTIKAVAGLRVSEEEEYRGVDVSECGLEAYPEFTSGPK